METDVENREQDMLHNRNRPPLKTLPDVGKPKRGRPKQQDIQPEQERSIIHDDGKTVVERCPLCGESVVMLVYSHYADVRYATCPQCQRRLALRGNTARHLIARI